MIISSLASSLVLHTCENVLKQQCSWIPLHWMETDSSGVIHHPECTFMGGILGYERRPWAICVQQRRRWTCLVSLRTTVLGLQSTKCKAAVKFCFLSSTKHILIILLAVFIDLFICKYQLPFNWGCLFVCLCVVHITSWHFVLCSFGNIPGFFARTDRCPRCFSVCVCFSKQHDKKRSIITLSCL